MAAIPFAGAIGTAIGTASADDQGLRTLAAHGERALERLPWKSVIVRANLSKHVPMSIAGCYLMEKQLLVVGSAGKVYCLDRRNLEPRWVNALRFPLAAPPAEGPTHYAFLLKDHMGAHWIHAISKRSGSASTRFPVRVRFSASSGISVSSSHVFVGSLGMPGNNKTLESVNLLTGRRGWGYRATGMLWASPQISPSGGVLVMAADNGVVTALSASASAPSTENWMRDLGSGIWGTPSLTPNSVIVGNDDGLLYSLDLFSGRVNWLQGIDERIRARPWVLGGMTTVEKSSGVEGAAPIKVQSYEGIAFAANVKGLHAFDLRTGTALFHDAGGGRPVCRQGKYLLTIDRRRQVTIRDTSDGYKVTGNLGLQMFDLVPCNTRNGEIFACTADGNVVAAIPR
jgi:outer membrane protein assembly factor BamB